MPPEITIRRASAADIPAIWDIRTRAIIQTCSSHYAPALIDAWVRNPMPGGFSSFVETEPFFVASVGQSLVGFAALKRASSEIDAVFVCPTFTRHGLGMRLLSHLESVATALGLYRLKLDASLNAVPFYQAAGYEVGHGGVHVAQSGLQIPCMHMEKRLHSAAGVQQVAQADGPASGGSAA